MSNEITTFANRLRQARIRNRLSMEGLSQLVNGSISKQAISKYETEKMMPSSSNLISLAKALNVDVDYFFRPFTFDIQEMTVSFRKKASIGVKDTEALKIQIQNEIENYIEIEEILQVEKPFFKNKNLHILQTIEDMVDCARNLREEWSLGIAPISNIQEMLETNGFKVIITNGPEGFDGVSGMVNNDKPIMVLNKNVKMAERLRFTSLHEAGHLLFNSSMDPSLTPRERERMCDAFASEMLLPSAILRNMFYGKSKISLKELTFLQESYGISIDAIMYKLKDLGYISEKRFTVFHIRKNKNKELKRVVEESRFKEIRISRFPAMVYSALAQQLITTSKAASMLGCSSTTIRNNLNAIQPMETFVVSDTDIFMDLIKAGLLGEFFHLPFEIHTTDLVVFQLKDKPQLSVIQTFIDSKWLHIKTLTSKEMTRLAIMKNNALKNYDATIQDCSAWLYAKENAFSILASDGRSRIIAETLGVKALDIRFILDKMVEHKIINYATAKNKIAKLSHTIDRLSTKKFSKGFILGKPNQKRRIMKT